MPHESITNFINVNSVAEYAKKVEKLGGKVIKLKIEVPGLGWFVACMDTENNVLFYGSQKATTNYFSSAV